MVPEVYQVATAALGATVLTGAGAWLVFGTNKVTRPELREQMDLKANKETVDVQYENILTQLRGINTRLERMEGNDD